MPKSEFVLHREMKRAQGYIFWDKFRGVEIKRDRLVDGTEVEITNLNALAKVGKLYTCIYSISYISASLYVMIFSSYYVIIAYDLYWQFFQTSWLFLRDF